MKFKKFTVPPEGRNKYGNYMSSSNVTQAVVKTTYYGDSSTNNGKPDKDKEPTPEPEPSFLLFLSKTYTKFDGQELSLTDVEDNINLIGYKNLTRCDTYVGAIDGTTANDAARATKVNYDIQGIPEVGMTVIVENNGTPETNIKIIVSKDMTATKGTLKIPCSVYRNSSEGFPLGDDISAWESLVDECTTLWLEYNWDVMTSSSDAYILELTNDNASINCDADGNILSGAYKPTCTAELYYGTEKVADATYGISYLSTQNVQGVSIDTTTGIITFGSNFNFDGTPLELQVTASVKGNVVGRKVMTISKAMAGKDGANGEKGEDAVSKWIVVSSSAIYVDYNYNPPKVSPNAVTVKAYKQVGANPVELSNDTIYYGYDTENPSIVYNGAIPVDVSKKSITVGIKDASGKYYDIETIPMIEAGLNGVDGEDGTDGKDGKDGQSAYRLDLTNDNASINCDSDGNVLSGAYKPRCTARLFLGTTVVENATYEIVSMSENTDITINSSSGVITVGNIDFENTTLEITVAAKIGGVIYGQSIMTIAKVIAGAKGDKGEDGTNGENGADGVNGKDGTSIIWKGEFASHPSNPQNGWAYRNTTDKKAYTYQDGVWYQMTVDGTDGKDGKDGTSISIAGTLTSSSQLPIPPANPNDCYIIGQDIWIWDGASWYNGGQFKGDNGVSIIWKGSHASHISNPEAGWAYYNTTDKRSYIYDGTEWDVMTYDGIDGTDGVDGISITWKGEFSTPPSNPKLNWVYRDTDNGKVYIYNGTAWEIMVLDGTNGKDGVNGADGVDGENGKDGVSIIWLGELASHPSYPQNGNAYKNTTDKKSYIYQDGTWYQMTVDGIDGQNGKDGTNGTNGTDGLSIVWKGEHSTAPSNPQLNWCYKDTDNGKVYIYNGSAWELMVVDGSDGEDGADGADGLSVFITYHDNPITSTPANPTGNGTTNGWHTTATKNANWMSQKVASGATAGTWGSPIQICGADGQNGTNGTDGEDAISYWMEFSANEVKLNKSGVPAPASITVQAYKQVGSQSPVNISSTATIKYGFNTVIPSTTYTSAVAIPMNTTYSYISFAMYVDNAKVDGNETILILRDGTDGTNGKDGADGRQGAAMRGPVNYYKQIYTRRWCNGVLTNASYPEDAQFIDIMIKDNITYVCTTSYNGSANDNWSSVSAYWREVENEYDFVATNILMAENASIDFATTNGLYLRNEDGDITAGAEGGDGISFWAGANEPENGKFKVYHNGAMEATVGKFGIFNVGVNDTFTDKGSIVSSSSYDYDDDTITNSLQIDEMGLLFMSTTNSDEFNPIKAHINVDDARYNQNHGDMTGVFSVEGTKTDDVCYYASGEMEASEYGFHRSSWITQQYAPKAMKGMEICFITDSSARFGTTTVNGTTYWTFLGNIIDDTLTKGLNWTTLTEVNGEWCVRYSSTSSSYFHTGIYTSRHTKKNNRIYIVI